MKLHRFYVPKKIELNHDFWIKEEALIHQWKKVLRMKAGDELVLFDGVDRDMLYKIIELSDNEAHLQLITELKRKLPKRNVYLFWSLLKKDKNDWVIQKCTELGVSHFVPLLADRSEKTGFNVERAEKIAKEASEQCGRSDIPYVREPILISTAISEMKNKITIFVCEQSDQVENANTVLDNNEPAGLLVGPEGGWSDQEKSIFKEHKLNHISIHDFTLRAETAAVTATAKLLQ